MKKKLLSSLATRLAAIKFKRSSDMLSLANHRLLNSVSSEEELWHRLRFKDINLATPFSYHHTGWTRIVEPFDLWNFIKNEDW